MTSKTWRRAALLTVSGAAAWFMVPATPVASQEAATPSMVAMKLQRNPPPGAVILFSGKPGDLSANWVARETTNPPSWKYDKDGIVPTKKEDITSKQEFGDCQIHAEFRATFNPDGSLPHEGNSGIGIMGRYEVQILASYGHQPSPEECGAFYSQVPPRVIACKKTGEWNSYDIIFRAPRLAADGTVISQPRATVYLNGIIVQDNTEFTGPTGIQHSDFPGVAATGPIVLQGDHAPVQYRNIWVVPL